MIETCRRYYSSHRIGASRHLGNPLYRGGAEEARWAHNPEDVGSNPTSGIVELDVKRSNIAGVAQRKSA